jgi:uncharacterized protein (DUF2252 family)
MRSAPHERTEVPRSRGRFRWATIAVFVSSAVNAACSISDEQARAQWLRHSIVLDNQPFLDRAPDLVEGKFAIMAESFYAFMRGTATQFAQDVMLPGGAGRIETAYLTPRSRSVTIMGDPHPENLGTFLTADGLLVLEYNDFDGGTFGPYIFDVRRMAVGHWVFVEQVARDLQEIGSVVEIDEAHRRMAVEAAARGYAEEIGRIDAGEEGLVVDDRRRWGVIVNELFERTRTRGQQNDRLRAYTQLEDDRRVLRIADIDPPRIIELSRREKFVFEDTLVEVSAQEIAMLEASLDQYGATLLDREGLRFDELQHIGFARRMGAGVSSYPNLRYYALLQTPGDDPDGAILLEVKETIDPMALPGLERFPDNGATTNAERSVVMQRRFQTFEDSDPWLGWAASGGQSLRIRERSSYQRNHAVDRVVRELDRGNFEIEDIFAFAELAGRILARSHAMAPRQNGQPAGPAIAAAIAGDVEGFVEEAAGFVDAYVPRFVADHELFVELVEEHGFYLGYRRF